MNESLELQLKGGESAAEVVRIEDTVRRSLGPNSELSHATLKLLEKKGFSHAPRFLGIDEKGREIVTFIEGDVPHSETNWTNDQLTTIAKMLKDFHDATAGSELTGTKEVICHNDLAPWNIVLKDGVPTAFIDFDDVAPGNRVDDLAYFLWTFLQLGSNVPATVQAEKIQKLLEAYNFTDKHKLINAILEQQEKILEKRKMLAQTAATPESREFSATRIGMIQSEIEWVKSNRDILEATT